MPTPMYQAYVLRETRRWGRRPGYRRSATGAARGDPFYRNLFSLYGNTVGSPVAVNGCPFDGPGVPSGGCANQRQVSLNNADREDLVVVKIDHTIDQGNSIWYRLQQDTGLQAAFTDPINTIFNSYSPQPQRTLVVGYTHLFTPNLINQLNPGASWYASVFEPNNSMQYDRASP